MCDFKRAVPVMEMEVVHMVLFPNRIQTNFGPLRMIPVILLNTTAKCFVSTTNFALPSKYYWKDIVLIYQC